MTRLRAAGCVFAEDEADLLLDAAGADPALLDDLVARRVAGLPLEHLLGWVAFHGRRYRVAPGVFVPRQRTTALVEAALARTGRGGGRVVVDLCCGCGAVGAALAHALRDAGTAVDLHATDVEEAAVVCARANLAGVGRVYRGDLDAALPAALRGRVDLLVANVPYVPTAAIAMLPPEAREHEPRVALDGGADGLAVFRRVAVAAPGWLAPGGRVLMEVDEGQSDAAAAALAGAGLAVEVAEFAESETTITIGTRESNDYRCR